LRVVAAAGGLPGALSGAFLDLAGVSAAQLQAISQAPGSAIGSSRQHLDDEALASLVEVMRREEIRYLLYTGGNGSMETALRLHHYATRRGYELRVGGIPKTIDNDLAVTDHAPGYPSAARFAAHALRDIGEDNRSLPPPVCVVEVLGRNTGWLAAATALARSHADSAPHLIYFPERPVALEEIAADVEAVYRRLGVVTVAVCEGQLNERGRPFGAEVDRAGSGVHRLASNLGHTLARELATILGLRVRAEKPGLLGRSCQTLASEIDRAESWRCGEAAARAILGTGEPGFMAALRRTCHEPYASEVFLTPLDSVARRERPLPSEFIAPDGKDVTDELLAYLAPLTGGLPPHPRLEPPKRGSPDAQ
jgi:6-phosphofructokinase 1